jgi:flagellar biosynthesis/type III secretory pathway chaperone
VATLAAARDTAVQLAPRPTISSPAPAPDRAGTLDDLLALLAAQATTYEQVLSVADERRGALVAADTERLGELAGRERPRLERLRKLEAWRLQVVRPWAARLGVAAEDVTVSQLATLREPWEASALRAATERLRDTAERVAAANMRNHDLLEACLDSVNASIHHLLQAVQVDPRYAPNGNRAGSNAAPRLADLKA